MKFRGWAIALGFWMSADPSVRAETSCPLAIDRAAMADTVLKITDDMRTDDNARGAHKAFLVDGLQKLLNRHSSKDKTRLRYKPEALLGIGGSGAVVKVFDRDLNREVAIKIPISAEAEVRRGFEKEARIANEMQSLHQESSPLPESYELFYHEGLTYHSMELLSGGTEYQRWDSVTASSSLSLPELKNSLRDLTKIGDLISRLHVSGYLHLDIKSTNIGFGARGPLLIDPANATAYDVEHGVITETPHIYTTGFTAPEVEDFVSGRSQNYRAITAKADVYSFAVLLNYRLKHYLEATKNIPGFENSEVRIKIAEFVAQDLRRATSTDPNARPTMGELNLRLKPLIQKITET